MSEYQYYEFQAIDRPLTEEQMDELRSYSSRAHITATSFVNHYNWGSFRGNENAWMEKYFDAFLYFANWGTHVLKFRLPCRLLDPQTAAQYCAGECACVRERAGKVILSFVSEEEPDDEWLEGEGHLSSLISVRGELARADLRALYLGWLLNVQAGECDDEEAEPPVPPGLGNLSGAQESLVEFLRIDNDLLHVAAQASAPLNDAALNFDAVQAWIAELPAAEKDVLLTQLVVNGEPSLIGALLQRFIKEQSGSAAKVSSPQRTVAGLLQAAQDHSLERERIEAERKAQAKGTPRTRSRHSPGRIPRRDRQP